MPSSCQGWTPCRKKLAHGLVRKLTMQGRTTMGKRIRIRLKGLNLSQAASTELSALLASDRQSKDTEWGSERRRQKANRRKRRSQWECGSERSSMRKFAVTAATPWILMSLSSNGNACYERPLHPFSIH